MRTLRTSPRGLAAALVLSLGATAVAQDTMEEKLEAKMAKEFIKSAAWVTDYDKALEQAKAENKLVFGYFTRSYAP